MYTLHRSWLLVALLGGWGCGAEGPPADEPLDAGSDTSTEIPDSGLRTGFPLQFGEDTSQRVTSLVVDDLGRIHIAGEYEERQFNIGPHGLSGSGGTTAFVASFTGTGEVIAASNFESGGTDDVLALRVDRAGHLYVAGRSREGLVAFGTPVDGTGIVEFIARLDLDEATMDYEVRWIDTSGVETMALTPDGNELLVVSWSAYGTTIRRLSTADGSMVASLSIGDESARQDIQGRAIAVNSVGHVLVGGHYSGAIDFGEGPLPAQPEGSFLVCLRPDHSVVFSALTTGEGTDRVKALTVDASDNVYLGGTFGDSVDWGGGPLPAPETLWHLVFASFTPDGTQRWSRNVNATGLGQLFHHAGDLYLLARRGATSDVLNLDGVEVRNEFMVQMDLSGRAQRRFEGFGDGSPNDFRAAFTRDGDIVLAGHFSTQLTVGGVTLETERDGPLDHQTDIFVHREASTFTE